MDTYIILYLFVKLDDIRAWFDNDYGLSILVGTAILVLFVSVLAIDDSNEYTPGYVPISGRWVAKASIALKGFAAILCVQIIFNVIATFLPSTGQMAAIYLGANAADSAAMVKLSELPEKYAELLNRKADEWLAEQIETNTPEEPNQ